KQGDHALFYHSGKQRAVVGIVEIAKEYHPDPTDESGKFGQVSVKTLKPLPQPVTLQQIKAEPTMQDLALVRQPRLSVMPVEKKQFDRICKLAGG
ncbi:MAG: EVE domain-containing protein, partial [Phycisphaeraceae bacterium]